MIQYLTIKELKEKGLPEKEIAKIIEGTKKKSTKINFETNLCNNLYYVNVAKSKKFKKIIKQIEKSELESELLNDLKSQLKLCGMHITKKNFEIIIRKNKSSIKEEQIAINLFKVYKEIESSNLEVTTKNIKELYKKLLFNVEDTQNILRLNNTKKIDRIIEIAADKKIDPYLKIYIIDFILLNECLFDNYNFFMTKIIVTLIGKQKDMNMAVLLNANSLLKEKSKLENILEEINFTENGNLTHYIIFQINLILARIELNKKFKKEITFIKDETFNGSQKKIIEIMLTEPEKFWHWKEINDVLNLNWSKQMMHKTNAQLEKKKMILKKKEGNKIVYQLITNENK